MGRLGAGRRGRAGARALLALCGALAGVLLVARGVAAEVTMAASAGTTAYVERTASGTVFVDASLALSGDEDVTSCEITVAPTSAGPNDALTAGSIGDLSENGGYQSGTKKLTLSGTASPADYQAALRSVSFSNPSSSPDMSFNGRRTVVFTLTTASGSQVTVFKYVQISLVDDAPVVTLGHSGTLEYTEPRTGAGDLLSVTEMALDEGLVLSDADSSDLTGATVSITRNLDAGSDTLEEKVDVTAYVSSIDMVTPLGLTSSWDAASGTLTITGTAPKATYQEILRSVVFSNTAYTPVIDTRTVEIKVTDGNSYSTPATITLGFKRVNQITTLSMETSEITWNENGGALQVFYGVSLSDFDNTTLTNASVSISSGFEDTDVLQYGTGSSQITADYDTATGIMTLEGTTSFEEYVAAIQSISYLSTDEAPAPGPRSVALTVHDIFDDSNTVSRIINVVPENDLPVAAGTTQPASFEGRMFHIQPDVVLSDKDNATLVEAIFEIVSGCDPVDTLVFSSSDNLPSGITVSSVGCLMRLTGEDTLANYQDVLQRVQLQQTSAGSIVKKQFDLILNDRAHNSTTLSRTVYASDYLAVPAVTSVTSPPTSGGLITITGSAFGPVFPNLVDKVQIGVSQCSSPEVTVEDTEMTCIAVAGSGSNLAVEVTISDVKSPVVSLFSYLSTTVTAVTKAPTSGGTITITGTNFGPVGDSRLTTAGGGSITVGSFTCTSGTVTVADTEITCTMPPGVGTNLDVIVTVAGLGSGTTGNDLYTYESPVISTLARGSFLGYEMTIDGSNFGPSDTSGISVSFKENGCPSCNTFDCSSATVSAAHSQLTCSVPAASLSDGANTNDLSKMFDVSVTVGGITETYEQKFQYEGPVITSIETVSYYGDVATIVGRNFGPADTTATVGIGSSYSITPTVGTCATCTPEGAQTPIVTIEDNTLLVYFRDYVTTGNTMTPSIQVTIEGQTSSQFTGFQYEGPVITGTSTGSQFGEYSNLITITGRNFGPAVGFSSRTFSAGSESISIDGVQISSGTQTVASATEITTSASTASALSPNSAQGLDILLSLYGQNSGTTGNEKFNFVGPVVTAVSSVSTAGGVVTITGSNFGPVQATADYFGGSSADTDKTGVTLCADTGCSSTLACSGPQVTIDDTQITCTMASGLPINTDVTVTMYDGTLTSGSTGAGLLSVNAPAVSSMDPASGITTAGGTITVTGTSFGPIGSSHITITLGGEACASATVTTADTTATCAAPAGTGSDKDLAVTITNNEESLTSAANTLFSYGAPTPSAATTIPTSGGTVTITGTNFGPVGSDGISGITVNGAAVTSASVTVADTTIEAVVDVSGTGSGYPLVVTIDGISSTDVGTFNLFGYDAPEVTGVTTRPSIFGGEMVLTGKNFGPTGLSRGKIDIQTTGDGTNTCAAPSVTAHETLTCTIICSSPCSPDTRDVTVTIDSQSSGTTGNGLLSYEGPVITAVAETSFHGTSIGPLTITGRNFGQIDGSDGSSIDYVKICSKSANGDCISTDYETATGGSSSNGPRVIVDSTSIEAYTLPHTGDDFSVILSVSGVESTGGDGLLDFIGPTITATDDYIASTVTTAGGTLTVTGDRFGPTGTSNIMRIVWENSENTITPASSGASVTVEDEAIEFTIPAGVGDKKFSLWISNDGTTANALSTESVYMRYDAPTITSVTPVSSGGGSIVITGTNFGVVGTSITDAYFEDLTGTAVNLADVAVTADHTEITATVPAGSGGGLDLYLTVGGQVATGTAAFSYSPPLVTSITSIATGPTWTATGYDAWSSTPGAWVTITGTNFGPSGTMESLTLGGVDCENPFVTIADTEIMCLFGPGSGGAHDVAFTIGGQALASSSGVGAFGYDPPTISTSAASNYFGGVLTTIVGTNFGPLFGDTEQRLPANASVDPPEALDQTISVTIDGDVCVDPAISVGHTEITCTPPARLDVAVISDLDLVVSIGDQSVSDKFAYGGPSVTSASTVSFFGGSVTVTGANFGPVGDSNIESLKIGGVPQDLAVTTPSVTVADTELVFEAVAATGTNLNLELFIRGQSTGSTGNGKLDFIGPRISSIIPPTTAGGVFTIVGENFGPVGSANIEKLSVEGVVCTNPTVSTANSEITCSLVSGSGSGKTIVLRINGESDQGTGAGAFAYAIPTISSVDPLNAPAGETIVMNGTSFGAEISDVTITIGGEPCQSIAYVAIHTSLECVTPKSVGENKEVRITVDGLVSAPGTAFSFSAPEVTSVTGLSAAGGVITITGDHFGLVGPDEVSVKVGAANCTEATVTIENSQIVCDLPAAQTIANGGDFALEDLGDDGMDVVVTIGGQPSSSGTKAFVFDKPTVSEISILGAAKDDVVQVTGTNLGTTSAEIAVFVDLLSEDADGNMQVVYTASANATFITSIGQDSFSFQMPAVAGSTNEVRVEINGRNADYAAVDAGTGRRISYAAPTITSSAPPASTEGGVATFTGTGFGPLGSDHIDIVHIVYAEPRSGELNCTDATVTVEDTELQCTVGAGRGGGHIVTVTVRGKVSESFGGVEDASIGFSYPVPTVTSVTPTSGPAGTIITVTGTNFGDVAGDVFVKMKGIGDDSCGGIPCTQSNLTTSHTQILCETPISVGGNVPIVVSAADLENEGGVDVSYTYPDPEITSISRGSTGGSVITISGNNFGPAGECYQNYIESVQVAGSDCGDPTVTVTGEQVICLVAEGSGPDHDAVVTMRGANTGTSGNGLYSYLAPTVTHSDPLPTFGGVVKIYGTDFGPVGSNSTAPPEVTFSRGGADVECANAVISVAHEEISCTYPAGTGAGYDISITVDTLNSGDSGEGKFRYQIPAVTTLGVGPSGPGQRVTVVGTNFGTDERLIDLKVGDKMANQTSIRLFPIRDSNEAEVSAAVPFGAGEFLPVTAIVDGQQSLENPDVLFSYDSPLIINVTTVGTQGGIIEILGENFGEVGPLAGSVNISGVACADPQVTVGNSRIQCVAAPGSGAGHDIDLQVTQQAKKSFLSSGINMLRYECPEILQVAYSQPNLTAVEAGISGQRITLTGKNFGGSIEDITMHLVHSSGRQFKCADIQFDETFSQGPNNPEGKYRISAQVPVGYGTDLAVLLNVNGQDNAGECAIKRELSTEDILLFDYPAPVVQKVNAMPTTGGRMALTGMFFGPTGIDGVQKVAVVGPGGVEIPCENATVVADNTVLECELGEGMGKGLMVGTSIGEQTSEMKSILDFQLPLVQAIAPQVVSPGDTITVKGLNFGNNASLIESKMFNSSFSETIPFNTFDTIKLTKDHTEMEMTVPMGTGTGFTLEFQLPKGGGVDSIFTQTSQNDVALEAFNYHPPMVKSITSVPTSGGQVTISGSGFGENDAIVHVHVGGRPCAGTKISMSDSELQCSVEAGVGSEKDVSVWVAGQETVSSALFGYDAPTVTSITPNLAQGGRHVTITGTNFGSDSAAITPSLGTLTCLDVQVTQDHTEIQCKVPPSDEFCKKEDCQDMQISMDVASVKSEPAGNFTYALPGCMDTDARNFNSLATEDDGTCIIVGCTDSAAETFLAKANENNQKLCIYPPKEIEMKVDLDYDEYLEDKARIEDTFVTDIADNLGVSKERIVITGSKKGSVIFTFLILDDPEVRAQNVMERMEEKLMKNDFSISYTILEVKTPNRSEPIKTKAAEPRVNTTSIIAVGACTGAILLWAIFWRQTIKCVATCGGCRKVENADLFEEEDFMERGRGRKMKGDFSALDSDIPNSNQVMPIP